MTLLTDFPKIHCPFVRQIFPLKHAHKGKREAYLAIDQVNPGYEWVFDHPDTIAVEKLDGTNVKVLTEGGRLVAIQNRMNVVDPLLVKQNKAHSFIIEGVLGACLWGYVLPDGEQAGEVIGPKLQGNPYGLERHIWYPFEKVIAELQYKSFHKYDRTLANFSSWFETNLFSLLAKMRGDEFFAEGVIFYNLTRRDADQQPWVAKLRRDMFDWYYAGVAWK